MENIYFLFEDLENWEVWSEIGYSIAFLLLFVISLLYTTMYYLLFGRSSMRYATLSKWFIFMLFNAFTVFIVTLIIEGVYIFNLSFGEFFPKLWLFTIYNTCYSFILYLLLSIVLKRFSIHSKYIPVKF